MIFLKGGLRILKAGVHVWGVLKADNVWLPCCALHWLLKIDGYGGVWNGGVSISDWTGQLGDDMDFDSVNKEIPNLIAWLCQNLDHITKIHLV